MRLKKQGKIFTLKQASKFQKGMRQSQQDILKPTNRDEALYLDYTGIQCVCGGWRIRTKADSHNLECYDCDYIMPPSHISKCENCKTPLYKERLVWIINHKNKCKNCDELVDLPQVLVDDAKS